MAIYSYRCPGGGEEVDVVAAFGKAPQTVRCDEHRSDCYRTFRTAAAYMHSLRSAYFIPAKSEGNRKAKEAFIKQEERRGHDVRGRSY